MTYLQPQSTVPISGVLTLDQFIQKVISGVSGINGNLVRPKWQPNPPKSPELEIDWIAYGIVEGVPDANSYVSTDSNGVTTTQRHQQLEVKCSIYGPNGMNTMGLLRDGFQIPQNLMALRAANMGFVEIGRAQHVPDLVHERFINRLEVSIFLRQETVRTYPVPTLISANGTITTDLGDGPYNLDWQTKT